MHHLHTEFARQITESRIAQAEHARTVRGLTRSPRPGACTPAASWDRSPIPASPLPACGARSRTGRVADALIA